MFYLATEIFGVTYWVRVEDGKCLINSSALFADCFEYDEIMSLTAQFATDYPHLMLIAIRADSTKIIPDNMRKVLRIA